jgi:hypothetical protein
MLITTKFSSDTERRFTLFAGYHPLRCGSQTRLSAPRPVPRTWENPYRTAENINYAPAHPKSSSISSSSTASKPIAASRSSVISATAPASRAGSKSERSVKGLSAIQLGRPRARSKPRRSRSSPKPAQRSTCRLPATTTPRRSTQSVFAVRSARASACRLDVALVVRTHVFRVELQLGNGDFSHKTPLRILNFGYWRGFWGIPPLPNFATTKKRIGTRSRRRSRQTFDPPPPMLARRTVQTPLRRRVPRQTPPGLVFIERSEHI